MIGKPIINMEPKLRTFVPVVVRGEEGEGVRFWGFGKTVYQEILGYIDPDYGDITDPTSGRDLTIEYKSIKNFFYYLSNYYY